MGLIFTALGQVNAYEIRSSMLRNGLTLTLTLTQP